MPRGLHYHEPFMGYTPPLGSRGFLPPITFGGKERTFGINTVKRAASIKPHLNRFALVHRLNEALEEVEPYFIGIKFPQKSDIRIISHPYFGKTHACQNLHGYTHVTDEDEGTEYDMVYDRIKFYNGYRNVAEFALLRSRSYLLKAVLQKQDIETYSRTVSVCYEYDILPKLLNDYDRFFVFFVEHVYNIHENEMAIQGVAMINDQSLSPYFTILDRDAYQDYLKHLKLDAFDASSKLRI